MFSGGNLPDNNNTGIPAGPNGINGGAQTNSAAQVLTRNFSSAFVGPNWTALLNAIATGDSYVQTLNAQIMDQAFLATADYPYLIDRASDLGIIYPENIGMNENRI